MIAMKNRSELIGLILVIMLLVLATTALAAEKPNLELKADELLIDDLKAEVTAVDNVEFSRGNMKLRADRLRAKEQLKMIEADGSIVIEQQQRKLRGEELSLNTETEVGTLTGSPEYQTAEMLIKGRKFDFDLESGKLVVTGQVYLENQKEDMTAEAEKLIYYRDKKEAFLTGDVVVNRGTRRMMAEKMRIDLETNKIKAEGRTRLIVPDANQEQGDENGD